MRTKYGNECSCGNYKTMSTDFDSLEIAKTAAAMHCMLNGEHVVTTKGSGGRVENISRSQAAVDRAKLDK